MRALLPGLWLLSLVFTAGCSGVEEVEASPKKAVPIPEASVEEDVSVTDLEPPKEAKKPCAVLDASDRWTRSFLQRAMPGAAVLSDPQGNRLQVLVGEIDRKPEGRCITWHPYRMDAEYVYPASAIKPIAAVAALNQFRQRLAADPALKGVLLGTPVKVAYRVAAEEAALAKAVRDGPPPPGAPVPEPPPASVTSVAKEIRASLSVSSNPAYNFTVDLAGVEQLHELMWNAGLPSVRLRHRLSLFGLSNKDQRTTARLVFQLPQGEVELVPERIAGQSVPAHGRARPGVGLFRKQGREIVPGPKDFSEKNSVSLMDMARLTAWIADPALAPELSFPLLEPEDRTLLRQSMSFLHPDWEEWMPLRVGMVEVIPGDDLLYLHKSGMAYGFYLDVGYVEQKSTGRAFMIAVAAHLNPNNVINDGQYGYKTMGNPMMRDLGRQLARELLVKEGE